MNSLHETVFDLAYGLQTRGTVSEKKATARKASAIVIAATTSRLGEDPMTRATSELQLILGPRAAARLITEVSPMMKALAPPKSLWKPNAAPSIAILTSKTTAEFAGVLYDALREAGANPWFYGKSIKLGRRIRHEDDRAIEQADYVVLLVSRDALSSNFIDYELDIVHWLEMHDRRERLLPVIADDLAFEELPLMLRPLSAIRFRDVSVVGILVAIKDRVAEDRKRDTHG